MRIFSILLVGFVFVLTAYSAEETTSIFNGKDLTGWEGNPKLWSVEDGAITGKTGNEPHNKLKHNTFLVWKGGEVSDFELKCKYKIVGGNSGIQYRSKVMGQGEFGPRVGGYQGDFEAGTTFSGILYDEGGIAGGRGIMCGRGEKVKWNADNKKEVVGKTEKSSAELQASIKKDDWNDLVIIANGNKLVHIINGNVTAEILDESPKALKSGVLALQIHVGPVMTVQFKEITLKKLANSPEEKKKVTKSGNGSGKKKAPEDPKLAGKEPLATPSAQIKTLKGFKVELLHSVPAATQGSWVSMCTDPKGRLIVSDQNGGLFRVTPPPIGDSKTPIFIEKIPADIGEAQGLLWAFNSLYVMVNKGGKYEHGLYRVRDTDGDDQLDQVTMLQKLSGGGEHGPHAILLSPDGKSLVVVIGNQTKLVDFKTSRVPVRWGEDHLLPRMPDGRGFMAGVMGPGGTIYKIDPDAKNWEIMGVGFRNEYDAAFNRQGELFTYDADMEWDFNTPWYRPTRILHVISGAEFGWRNGAGKWPAHYADSLPSVVDIGPGSPTGVTFGYGAKFPAKYQEAFFVCDWSYGKMYAVHLSPSGSTYKAEVEEFISGSPLPLTDLIVNPKDGALYFAIGGRKTKSGLYRVTYTGEESTALSKGDAKGAEDRAIRLGLEKFHEPNHPEAVAKAWDYLGSPDRFIRYAARVALEHQDVKLWQDKALAEKDPNKAITALLALVRSTSSDPLHKVEAVDQKLKTNILAALQAIAFDKLDDTRKLELLRTMGVHFVRTGSPDEATAKTLATQLDTFLPGNNKTVNAELCQMLVYLQSPTVAMKGVALLKSAATQEDQMEIARALRMLRTGWTPELKKEYFSWFIKAAGYKGGMSFGAFVENIKRDALVVLSDKEKEDLKSILEAKPALTEIAAPAVKRDFVKNWKMTDLSTDKLDANLAGGRNFEKGKRLFAETRCVACHRYENEGGAQGPDLTNAAGRFNKHDLLESLIDPNKVISDQYAGVIISTDDGKLTTGRIINLSGNNIMVNTDMLNPTAITVVDHRKVETIVTSKVSMMPAALIDTLKEDEIFDLLAYILSRGNPSGPMFAK